MNSWMQSNRKRLFVVLGTLLALAGAPTVTLAMLHINKGPLIAVAFMAFILVMASSFVVNLCLGWRVFRVFTLVLVSLCTVVAWYFASSSFGVILAVLSGLLSGVGLAIVLRQRADYDNAP